MTYNVFGGTLNLAQSINHYVCITKLLLLLIIIKWQMGPSDKCSCDCATEQTCW